MFWQVMSIIVNIISNLFLLVYATNSKSRILSVKEISVQYQRGLCTPAVCVGTDKIGTVLQTSPHQIKCNYFTSIHEGFVMTTLFVVVFNVKCHENGQMRKVNYFIGQWEGTSGSFCTGGGEGRGNVKCSVYGQMGVSRLVGGDVKYGLYQGWGGWGHAFFRSLLYKQVNICKLKISKSHYIGLYRYNYLEAIQYIIFSYIVLTLENIYTL